jgi:hypothetical protein
MEFSVSNSPHSLIKKIEALPAERLTEVEDFVDFIAAREEERAISRAAAVVSEPVFADIWNNAEDDVYDAL